MNALIAKLLDVARREVGYHEGRSGSDWNNHQKYSPSVPGLEWSQNQAWCATFVSWVAMKAGLEDYFPRTASTDFGARWFKDHGQWSEYPAVGAQFFLGHSGDMHHTGLVERYDDDFIYTIEGNTNTNGSAQGDGVYRLKRRRTDAVLQGYGYPNVPGGLQSADPTYRQPTAPKPKPKPGVRLVPFVLDHRSSRYDRSPKSLRESVAPSMEKATVITLTEINEAPRARVLQRIKRWALGRTARGDNSGEVGVVTREDVWMIVRGKTFKIADDLPGKGGSTQMRLQLLQHRGTGATLLVGVSHMPSGVEESWLARGSRVLRYRSAARTWRKIARRWAKKYQPDAQVMVADWNLDAHSKWVRRWLAGVWSELRLPNPLPRDNSHDSRLIDFPLISGIADEHLSVLPKTEASDHRGIRLSGNIIHRRKS